MANPTIGYIDCPLTGEKDCDVRRYSTGKRSLYYVGSAGKITPNLPAGQAWMKKNTRFINDNDKPLRNAPPVNGKTEGETKGNVGPNRETSQENNVKDKGLLGWFLDDE